MIGNGFLFRTNGGGYAKVINYTHSKNVLIKFQDEYKHRTITNTTHIRSGAVKNHWVILEMLMTLLLRTKQRKKLI